VKQAAIAILAAMGAFFVVMFITHKDEPINDRIARECAQTYGYQGRAAVDQCRLDMTARFLIDRQHEQRDATYSRIR
jgi:hypothetical protein